MNILYWLAGEEAIRGSKGEEEGSQGERVALAKAASTEGQAGASSGVFGL